jgi:hypothetical protein
VLLLFAMAHAEVWQFAINNWIAVPVNAMDCHADKI